MVMMFNHTQLSHCLGVSNLEREESEGTKKGGVSWSFLVEEKKKES